MNSGELVSVKSTIVKATTMSISGVIVGIIEGIAFLLNIFCIYLIKRQGFNSIDLWLAVFMSIKDSLFILYRIGQLIMDRILGSTLVFNNITYGQVDGLIVCSMVLSSVNCVAFLAMIRFWCLYLNKPINNKLCIGAYIIIQILILIICSVVASKLGFILMPVQGYFYPDPMSVIPVIRLCTVIIFLSNLFSIIAVNICYPLLTSKYFQKLQEMEKLNDHPIYPIKTTSHLQKFKIIIKTILMLFLYNLCMLPSLTISLKEQITKEIRSYNEDAIVAISVILLYIVNPLLFMTLHDGIYYDMKSVIRSSFHYLKR